MGTKNGLVKKFFICVVAVFMLATVLTACELEDPIRDSTYYINDNQSNYYNKDHTTNQEAVDEFTDSITALRKYLDSESFVDSGYYMGVDFDIDLRDTADNTVGNFALDINAYLYTYPYEDDDGNPIYKYYENGVFYDENNEEGSRTLVSALEIHNEAIKKSDISIEWKDQARNEVLIGLYFDGVNSNADNPGNILYVNIQGYKRSFIDFGDTVIYQQMIRLLVNLSVEGLLEALGLQADAGTSSINTTMSSLIGENYKRVVNDDLISLYFYSVALDAIAGNVNELLYDLLGVFERKWDPMTNKFLGFKFSTVANAIIQTINADMQAIVAPDKSGVTNVLTNAGFDFFGVVNSYDVLYSYDSSIRFDYGWSYPEELTLDTLYYTPFDYGHYEFEGTLYVPSWDAQFDAEIKTDFQQYDNSLNNVFMEFRDIANGELMIGVYYRNERAYLDISGMAYMYGWIDVEDLGFPQVYDTSLDLAQVLNSFFNIINNTIVAIVDSILDPASTDKENKVLEYVMAKTTYTEKDPLDIFSINSETLQVDIELVKQMLEETGAGTYSTRQIINILDSMMPYTMDQIAIMLGISSAEVMLEKTYFTLTWDVDIQEFTIIMYTNVGVPLGDPSTMIFRLELIPVYFGEDKFKIPDIDFSDFKPLGEIYTYSGTLRGNFIFSSQETVDLSQLLSATIGESSGLNTPYVLAQNAGLSFTLVYDQFVTDQYADGRWKLAGRSSFELTVWLTGSESTIIIGLASDDVSFNNDVYKDQPAREAELGYVWVNIACVTKNGTQTIPKVKIREDVFMASMTAYMNNETSIEDDVNSFADNDVNLSLTSIITALCKDAYVIPASEQLEITSSNETLQNLFRVDGLIGNIKVDAGFRYRVEGLESIKKEYYMYEVGYFDNIVGNSPYDTALHKTLTTFFYEDYMDDYDPLKYDFLVYADNVVLDDGTQITSGTMYIYQLGARRTVSRQSIDYPSSSFFNKQDANNQDIAKVKFLLSDLILDPSMPVSKDNMLVFENDGRYYYRTNYGKQRAINDEYIEVGDDGTVYVYWQGINEVVFHEEGETYYFYDRNRAILDENGNQVYLGKTADRDLLFVHEPESVEVTEDCKTQYAPRTNGSFMGEVRRYFVTFETNNVGELGKIDTLYYDSLSEYPQYYSKEDEEFVVEEYSDEGVLISSTKTPIMLYVMEPCEPLQDTVKVNVKTDSSTTQLNEFNAQFVIDWELASGDKRGYMEVTEVVIAPGMMGEKTFPVRIIVVNREIDTETWVSVYTSEEEVSSRAPVVDEIDVDPYDYAIKKYEYLSDTANFNPALLHSPDAVQKGYDEAVKAFTAQYFAQEKFAFSIEFAWLTSYLYEKEVGDIYISKEYQNYVDGELTRYDWNYDLCDMGTNLESSVSPIGGTIYLHTYFRGQLIALKVNIGKREFSHLKFYDTDDFDPNAYNAENGEYDPYVNGVYRGNYYDSATYEIETRPIFVFTDGVNEYEYVFDMKLVTGLLKNTDGSYSGAYQTVESYWLKYGNATITNVTSIGSSYGEYSYSYLYKTDEFDVLETRYDALSDAKREKKVKVFNTANKTIYEDYLYVRSADGRVSVRKSLSFAELSSILTESEIIGTAFAIDYGTGTANKYASDRTGLAMVRDTDVEGETELVNRPFYYFYLKSDPSTPVYLTEEEYELYASGDTATREKYGFNTDNTTTVTTAGLDLYYLFRVYFTYGDELYALSTLSNKMITPDKLNDQAIGATDFSLIELRIEADCPQLDVDEVEGAVTDGLTGQSFVMSKVDAGDSEALGYYKVDPLNASTLYLPDSMKIFFEYEDFASSHTFSGLEWCAYFDADGNPVYTYYDTTTGTEVPLIVKESNGRYKVAIDVEKLTEELVFRAMLQIGNATSGYRVITVAVRILSKDPTNVDFYVNETGEKLDTPSTTVEINSGDTKTKLTYYTYYANTFENFKLPDRLIATFSDGHTQTYTPTWKPAKSDAIIVFEPNTTVTLVTTIGTQDSEDSVTVDIYLVVVVENYDLSKMEVSNEFSSYYVTIKSENGDILDRKVTVDSLFKLNGKEIGYYYQSSSTYYVHISTGSADDGETPGGEIGLYTYDNVTGRYVWNKSVTVYDFISALYSRATLSLSKSETEFDNQQIINENASIFDHEIRVKSTLNSLITMTVKVSDAVSISHLYQAGDLNPDVMTIEIGYVNTASGEVYVADVDDDGMLTLSYNNIAVRKISYAELASYVIGESLAIKYVEWRVVAVNGVSADVDNKPFTSSSILSDYISYNSEERKVSVSSILGLYDGGTIELKNSANETVVMKYDELVYRLNYYYNYVRVTNGTTKVVANKSIAIQDLYKIMDINDMLYRVGVESSIAEGKYVVGLGTGEGSYDLRARLVFTGGYYLSEDAMSTETINVEVYTTSGIAQYAEGYIPGNAISAEIYATVNDGTSNSRRFTYNRTSTDQKLTEWYVEILSGGNPTNITGVSAGDLIKSIPAQAIYAVDKDRQITISTLTQEGFRITRTVRFEILPGSMSSGFSSGGSSNSNATTAGEFTISDGLITVQNIYDYTNPDVYTYLGSTDYLPSTVYVDINGKRISVSGVKWNIESTWYGTPGAILNTLTYKGTTGKYVMASADILGYTDASGVTHGATKIFTHIKVNSAEVLVLPWETDIKGNGLATETLVENGKTIYRVYVDAYADLDALRSGVIKIDNSGRRYLELPTELLANYTNGDTFSFSNVVYKYSGTYNVSKIYFDDEGIDVEYMISSGDLSNVSANLLSERELRLTVELGLNQNLDIGFYFHNKRVAETVLCYYTDYYNESNERVYYSDLAQSEKDKTVGDTDKYLFMKGEDGYVQVANLLYYYEPYYENGTQLDGNALTEEQREMKIENTDLNVFRTAGSGLVEKIALVYNDVSAVIDIDDVQLRAEMKSEKSTDFSDYQAELLEGINLIRVQTNLETVVAKQQEIRSSIRSQIESLSISADVNMTAQKVSELLLKWIDTVSYVGTYDESALPTRRVYTDEESYNYGLDKLISSARSLAYYNSDSDVGSVVKTIINIIVGSGSNVAKERNISDAVSAYFDDFMEQGYNSAIRGLIEKEYAQLFTEELSGMTGEQLNDTVYYKNLIEAGFDVDAVISDIYKLRSMKRYGVSVDLAVKQLDISLAVSQGYGFEASYQEYLIGGRKIAWADLSDAEKALTVTYGKGEPQPKYKEEGGYALVLTETYTYDSLAYAVIMQGIYEAYAYADKSFVTDDENFVVIKEVVTRLFENRINATAYCFGGTAYTGTKSVTYTLEGFVGGYAYNSTAQKLTKKVMRAYLVNLVREGMDFTAFMGTDTAWNDYIGLYDEIIAYSYNSISNYATTINSLRRSLLSGASITNVLRNLINMGIKSFTETVYAENVYMGTIKNMQEINGQIILLSRYGDDGYSLDRFADLLDINTARYIIEPYYLTRAIPHKIVVYFQGNDLKDDESGRVYETEISWTTDSISGKVTYVGIESTIAGTITSPVTASSTPIHVYVVGENRSLTDSEKVITTQYIEDGLSYAKEELNYGVTTSDGRYYMTRYSENVVRYYVYNSSFDRDIDYYDEGQTAFILTHKQSFDKRIMVEWSGYDDEGTIVYTFANEYDEYNESVLTGQFLYVYNPFEFSQSNDMPSSIIVGGEMMSVKWNNLGIQPTGNVDKTASNCVVKGKIESDAGQDVQISVFVARWSYAGIYRRTETTSGIVFNAEGVNERFVYMNPLNFYFSPYMSYSPENYFLISFAVSIIAPNADGTKSAQRITFVYDDVAGVTNVQFQTTNEGFVRKLFYPENSRLLEYGTDDDTMDKVNARKRYVLYWDDLNKNKVINSKTSQSGCLVYLGNSDVGEFTLDALKETTDTTSPTKATYSCERMYIDELCFVTVDGLTVEINGNEILFVCGETGIEYRLNIANNAFVCNKCGNTHVASGFNTLIMTCQSSVCVASGHTVVYDTTSKTATCNNEVCVLYEEIKDAITEQSGQAPVVISADGYFPTTGSITLLENNVHYQKDELRVRYLWTNDYEETISRIMSFVRYAYPDVEESSVRNYAVNILMTWDIITDSERDEILEYAQEYMAKENEYLGDTYTEDKKLTDAYALLAINQKYDFTQDVNKLRGGGNNNVVTTVIVGIEGSTEVFYTTVTVKVLFADYTPMAYYKKADGRYNNVSNALTKEDYLSAIQSGRLFESELYIAVRGEYWDTAESKSAYLTDGENDAVPYDQIGDDMYKLLQIYAERNAKDASGANRDYFEDSDGNKKYLIRITDIRWTYDEQTSKIVSESFTLDGVTYQSDLLQMILQ